MYRIYTIYLLSVAYPHTFNLTLFQINIYSVCINYSEVRFNRLYYINVVKSIGHFVNRLNGFVEKILFINKLYSRIAHPSLQQSLNVADQDVLVAPNSVETL